MAFLARLSLSDPSLSTAACALPATLNPTGSSECIVGPLVAVEGQFATTTTLSAAPDVTVTDAVHYLGVEEDVPPVIIIEGPVEFINGNIIVI